MRFDWHQQGAPPIIMWNTMNFPCIHHKPLTTFAWDEATQAFYLRNSDHTWSAENTPLSTLIWISRCSLFNSLASVLKIAKRCPFCSSRFSPLIPCLQVRLFPCLLRYLSSLFSLSLFFFFHIFFVTFLIFPRLLFVSSSSLFILPCPLSFSLSVFLSPFAAFLKFMSVFFPVSFTISFASSPCLPSCIFSCFYPCSCHLGSVENVGLRQRFRKQGKGECQSVMRWPSSSCSVGPTRTNPEKNHCKFLLH